MFLRIGSGVTLVLEPTATQYLQEANLGDPTDAVEVCITAVVENGLSLERSVTVSLGLSGETAGVWGKLLKYSVIHNTY